MPSYWDKNKGYTYVSSDYDFDNGTHGQHGAQHKREFEQVANDIFNKKFEQIIPEIEQRAYHQAINDFLSALKIDISSIVSVSMNNAKEIFYGEKCQTAIMSAILEEIRTNLGKSFTIK